MIQAMQEAWKITGVFKGNFQMEVGGVKDQGSQETGHSRDHLLNHLVNAHFVSLSVNQYKGLQVGKPVQV